MTDLQANDTEDNLNLDKRKQETYAAVWRLLNYAVSDANVDLVTSKPELIKKLAPILLKGSENLTADEISELLQAYNDLSQLISPATNESLRLKEIMEEEQSDLLQGRSGHYHSLNKQVKDSYANFWVALWVVIVVFIVYQSYVYFISDTLQTVNEDLAAINVIEDKISAAKEASNEPDKSRDNLKTKYPFNDLYAKRQVIWLELNSGYCVLKAVSLFWIRSYPDDGNICDPGKQDNTHKAAEFNPALKQCQDQGGPALEACQRDAREIQERAIRENFFAGAHAILRVSNYLVLPTMLGLLGALAYVIRGVLDSFSKSSFVLSSRRRWGMRVALGPLLGLISGIVIAPDVKDFKELSYSPLVWGFLMGYSVEFAFSMFDALIEKGRSALGSNIAKRDEIVKEGNQPPSGPAGKDSADAGGEGQDVPT